MSKEFLLVTRMRKVHTKTPQRLSIVVAVLAGLGTVLAFFPILSALNIALFLFNSIFLGTILVKSKSGYHTKFKMLALGGWLLSLFNIYLAFGILLNTTLI